METKIYSWGANTYGQLGQGCTSEQCDTPVPIDNFHGRDISQITGGGGHSCLIADGDLYACGLNDKGQLGYMPQNDNRLVTLFTKLQLKRRKVTQVACGWDFTLVLIENQVLAWGANTFGQLGKTDGVNETCLELPPVKQIAAGMWHSAAISTSGDLYMWGCSAKGQLGKGLLDKRKVTKPSRVCSGVRLVSCGQHHTVVVFEDFRLEVWGDNKHGQHVQLFETIGVRDVECGWSHVALLTDCGHVTTWGRSDFGQLGHCGVNQSLVDSTWNGSFVQVALGSEHSLALTDSGRVVVWGWNEHGNCGDGSTDNVIQPKCLSLNNVTIIGCGAGTSFAIACDR